MSEIHPTAYVDRSAEVGRDVDIGPFCQVGPGVVLGDGCRLIGHCSILGPSSFGERNIFHPMCVIGGAPQDLKYKGGPTRLEVGDDNVFREHVTVHRGTEVDAGVTRVGDRNLLMVGVHLAHDVELRSNVILANYVQIAGHCLIEEHVNVGGGSAMHHFVTVGRYAFVGGQTGMRSDVPPYMKSSGWNAAVRGVNAEGMKRWGLSDASIAAMKDVYRLLYGRRDEQAAGRTSAALREIESNGLIADEHVQYLVAFLRRQLQNSVHGRYLETRRRDRPADRESFYAAGRELADR